MQTLPLHMPEARTQFPTRDTVGQEIVTIATQETCDSFLQSNVTGEIGMKDLIVEGETALDKKALWDNIKEPRVCGPNITGAKVFFEVANSFKYSLIRAQLSHNDSQYQPIGLL